METGLERTTPQNLTERPIFSPTAKMQEYLTIAVENLTDSPTAISRVSEVAGSGIARRTWYDWLEIPGFEEWFYSEYKRLRTRIIPKLDEIAMKFASKGSYNHLELLSKKVGDFPDKPTTQVNIASGEMSVSFVSDDGTS